MKLCRCKECGKLPYISTGWQYFNEMHKAQVRCKYCSNKGESFLSADSKTCVDDAIANWNEWYSVDSITQTK